MIFYTLDPNIFADSDPGSQVIADPDPKHWFNGSVYTALLLCLILIGIFKVVFIFQSLLVITALPGGNPAVSDNNMFSTCP